MFNKEDIEKCLAYSQKEWDKQDQAIMTELKRQILSHTLILELRRPRREYLANQLATVFLKGKNLETALREIHQNCGRQTKTIAIKVVEDLALHLVKTAALPDEN